MVFALLVDANTTCFLQKELTGAGGCPFPGEPGVGQPCWPSVSSTARSLSTVEKRREHAESRALQKTLRKAAERFCIFTKAAYWSQVWRAALVCT